MSELRSYSRIFSNLAEGGVGEAFWAQARVQKRAGKALGTEIAEGGFWRAFLGSFIRGVVCVEKISSASPHDPFYWLCLY